MWLLQKTKMKPNGQEDIIMNINRVEMSLSELEQVSGGMPAFLESFTDTVGEIAGTVGSMIKETAVAVAECVAEVVKDPKTLVVLTLIP